MDKPGGFAEHLFVSHAQYLEDNGNEPFSHGNLTATLMEYFIAGHYIFLTFLFTNTFFNT